MTGTEGDRPYNADGRPARIRRAAAADADALLHLISALAEFENLPGPDEGARKRMLEYGFGENPKFEAWIAEIAETGDAAGYIILYETFSTFLVKPGLYLEDLFVLPQYRRKGIGTQLLRHCIALARERGCGRLEWTCLDWNVDAQGVYEGLGARRIKEWLIYRMTEEAQTEYLSRGE